MKLSELIQKPAQLDEVHYSDQYPGEFAQFYKKYAKILRDRKGSDLFVQFTHYRGNIMDRTHQDEPDHSDPAGTYAYPLKYVIKNPSDIWYGANARYLRVLEKTSDRVLWLDQFSSWQSVANWLSRNRVPNQSGRTYWDERELKALFKMGGYDRNSKMFAKTFMLALQMDFQSNAFKTEGYKAHIRDCVKSNREQNRFIRSLGYDTIIDTGTGAINEREPEQAIFLTRAAFRALEVFELRPNLDLNRNGGLTYPDLGSDKTLIRKFAALIALQLDDKLKEDSAGLRLGLTADYPNIFWTKKGREIGIRIDRPQRFYDRPAGEKKHKYDTTSTDHDIRVRVDTEYGSIETKNLSGSEKLSEIANRIGARFYRLAQGEVRPDWRPRGREEIAQQLDANHTLNLWNGIRRKKMLPPISMGQMVWMQGWNLSPLEDPDINPTRAKLMVRVNAVRKEKKIGLITWDQLQYAHKQGWDPLEHPNPGMMESITESFYSEELFWFNPQTGDVHTGFSDHGEFAMKKLGFGDEDQFYLSDDHPDYQEEYRDQVILDAIQHGWVRAEIEFPGTTLDISAKTLPLAWKTAKMLYQDRINKILIEIPNHGYEELDGPEIEKFLKTGRIVKT